MFVIFQILHFTLLHNFDFLSIHLIFIFFRGVWFLSLWENESCISSWLILQFDIGSWRQVKTIHSIFDFLPIPYIHCSIVEFSNTIHSSVGFKFPFHTFNFWCFFFFFANSIHPISIFFADSIHPLFNFGIFQYHTFKC